MSSVIPVQIKVGSAAQKIIFEVDRSVKYSILLDADESGNTQYALPGMTNPKFIAVFTSGYAEDKPPVEVLLQGADGERRACTPVALFTAAVPGGMDETTFEDAVPSLRFYNWSEQEVRVTVIAGE